jgi:hypothetical protein
MPFSLKGFFCGTDPNKTNITNAINLQYQSHLSTKIETVINSISNIINSDISEAKSNIADDTSVNSGISQVVEGQNWIIDGSIVNIDLNSVNDTLAQQVSNYKNNAQNISNTLTKIKDNIVADAKNSIDMAANLTAASELSNMDDTKTGGELNNLINKVSGLFDYQTTDTTINNTISHTFDNYISSKILTTINDTNNFQNLFNFENKDKVDNTLSSNLQTVQIVKLTNITVKNNAVVNINLNAVNKNVIDKFLTHIFSPINNAAFKTVLDKTITTGTTQQITQKVTISSVLKTTNTKKTETTSFIDSLLNMIMYVGIAVVVLVVVLAVVGGIILLMKKKKNGAPGDASSDVVGSVSSVAETVSDIKAIANPVKAISEIKVPSLPTKRIPGLPKF